MSKIIHLKRGSIERRGEYSWRLTVSNGIGFDGKRDRPRRTIKVLIEDEEKAMKAAAKALEEFADEVDSGRAVNSGKMKFRQYAEYWIEKYLEKNAAPKTIESYKSELERRIIPVIGNIRLEQLLPKHLIDFYSNLQEKGIRNETDIVLASDDFVQILESQKMNQTKLSEITGVSVRTLYKLRKEKTATLETFQKICSSLDIQNPEQFYSVQEKKYSLSNTTIQYYHRIIRSMLNDAVEWTFIKDNPAKYVKPPKKEKKEARFYEKDQAIEFMVALNKLKGDELKYKAAFALDMTMGARRGEILGLEWSDINFSTQVINIRQQSQYVGKEIITKSPKNETSIRKVKVPRFVIEVLKEYKAWQNQHINDLGTQWGRKIVVQGEEIDNNRLFTQWDGKPMYPSTLSSRFKKFIEENNLDSMNFHGLRHTITTLLIDEGLSIKAAGKRAGHAQGQTTVNIYAHATKSADEKASDIVDKVFGQAMDLKKVKKVFHLRKI